MALRACINGILKAADIAIEITTPKATRGNQMRINLEDEAFIMIFTPFYSIRWFYNNLFLLLLVWERLRI